MPEARILVVDDELSMREFLEILLEREGYEVHLARSGEEALEVVEKTQVDLVLSDLNMPGIDGLELMRRLARRTSVSGAPVPVILVTAFGTTDAAVEAMRQGAADYLLKPFDNDELLITVRRTLSHSHLQEQNLRLREELQEKYWFGNIVGSSAAMLEVYHLVQRIKDSRINCLLHGESGTGKEMIARAIHYSGERKGGPFVAVNCGAIPENLIESELFGFKKGSFTGALRDKEGYFPAASGGTLFLDEIGDMPLQTQVRVLRAIDQRKVVPVGGVVEVPVDLRIIAASNKDLTEEVAEGRFREDLFYRLDVVRIELPPLRDRDGDVLVLAREFVREYAKEYGKNTQGLTDAAEAALVGYDWPGNVRELRNAMERAVALERTDRITVGSLPRPVTAGLGVGGSDVGSPDQAEVLPSAGVDLDQELDAVERRLLSLALDATGGNKTQAAKLLRVTFRSFRYRLKKHGMADD